LSGDDVDPELAILVERLLWAFIGGLFVVAVLCLGYGGEK